VMAGSLVIVIPVGMAVLLFGWGGLRRYPRLGLVLSVLCMAAVLFLTKSRGAWMAFGVVVILLILLRWRRGWLGLPLGLLAAGIAALGIGLPQFLDILSTSGSINGIGGRIEIWSRAICMIQDFPFTGIGLGSFGSVADTLYPFFSISPGSIPHAHNLFLQLAVDLGIPGLIAWLATWGTMVIIAWQIYRRGKALGDGWIAGLGAGLLGSQVALVVHGFLDAVTWGMVKPAPIVWGLWGLTAAGWYVCCRPSSQSAPSSE
jgi:O-antigen ligase